MSNETSSAPATTPTGFDMPVTRDALKRDWGVHFSNVHLLRLEKQGKFPKRFCLGGPRTVAWLSSELAAWVSQCAATRNGGAAA
jgi:predicted DNA-binding transcriptional regulator AlpA